MLYQIIAKARDKWISSADCPVKPLIGYIVSQRKLRDAQLESIKTFLYLKLACKNQPLYKLMSEGAFNEISPESLDEMPLKKSTRQFLKQNPGALALYEYAGSKDDAGHQTAPQLVRQIEDNPSAIDYESILKAIFYGVTYTDYLFSIPMGAGKTWLMAAFVYLNLYFAVNEPDNPLFAHNFIILAPAGLKSSIIPSLKDMQEFNPAYIIPEPSASLLKAMLCYEFLEDDKSAKGSNLVKNPNALKIQLHQPFDTLMGLVAVTNVEKLYDRIDSSDKSIPNLGDSLSDKDKQEWIKTELANELRRIISELPNLCIMIDEVHHAVDEEIKLRKVVEKWAGDSTFNSVLGFSGTPYLSKPEKIKISDDLTVKSSMLSNVVTYYPLVDAIGNFLKVPTVKYPPESSADIVQMSVREFFEKYKDTVYPDVGAAKLAIYCGSIATLENDIFPEVTSICQEYGINPFDAILRYYRDDNKGGFKSDPEGESKFKSLDSVFSKVRIILLVGIGKEGWNCKSLTGVVLPNDNASAKNMVLQTSCRCLREVVAADKEDALIWLNNFNFKKLEEQLKKEHHTSVNEIQYRRAETREVKRYSRQEVVKLPKLSYLQLKITYNTVFVGDLDTAVRLSAVAPQPIVRSEVRQNDMKGSDFITGLMKSFEQPMPMEYTHWIALIAKESFSSLTSKELHQYDSVLRPLFSKTSIVSDSGINMLNPDIDQEKLRADIRRCFSRKTDVEFKKDPIPREASLLNLTALATPYFPSPKRHIYPSKNEVDSIMDADKGNGITEDVQKAIDLLRSQGMDAMADELQAKYDKKTDAANLRTYQYIPYSFDSGLEKSFYSEILYHLLDDHKDIEIYFNGDESLTEFYIDCYRQSGSYWKNIGKYYPDFLVLRRDAEGRIAKVIIIETKGSPYEASFNAKKDFMAEFIRLNNENGYTKFDFVYINESLNPNQRYSETLSHIISFLND